MPVVLAISFHPLHFLSSHYCNLALLKSISGCCALNRSSISSFFCSSLDGRPISFCRWSYIIFSTMPRVSPSRSDSLLLSGTILVTSMDGAVVTTCAHHSSLLALSRWISTVLVPSGAVVRVHVLSSTATAWGKVPCVRPGVSWGEGEGRGGGACLDDGFLALDPRRDGRLLDVDDEVAALEVARHGKGHVGVADGLRPLVGERVLLGLFLGLGRGELGGGLFWWWGCQSSIGLGGGGGRGGREETCLCQPLCRGFWRGARGGVEKAAWKLVEALPSCSSKTGRGTGASHGGAIFRELPARCSPRSPHSVAPTHLRRIPVDCTPVLVCLLALDRLVKQARSDSLQHGL